MRKYTVYDWTTLVLVSFRCLLHHPTWKYIIEGAHRVMVGQNVLAACL